MYIYIFQDQGDHLPQRLAAGRPGAGLSPAAPSLCGRPGGAGGGQRGAGSVVPAGWRVEAGGARVERAP